jgi:hypothetical protein
VSRHCLPTGCKLARIEPDALLVGGNGAAPAVVAVPAVVTPFAFTTPTVIVPRFGYGFGGFGRFGFGFRRF